MHVPSSINERARDCTWVRRCPRCCRTGTHSVTDAGSCFHATDTRLVNAEQKLNVVSPKLERRHHLVDLPAVNLGLDERHRIRSGIRRIEGREIDAQQVERARLPRRDSPRPHAAVGGTSLVFELLWALPAMATRA